ncbi:MAG: GNAT family N-acetyltransferase [Acetatifactor sp.]|nr:GNAT family N-acetyltransferase [Acetatifactor sp.]
MEIIAFKSNMQQSVADFFEKCFSAVGIPYSPMDRHSDIADVEQNYMRNGCFWCLFDNEVLIGTVAVRVIDIDKKVIELKRMFVLPEYQGKGYGRLLLEYAIDYAREQQYHKICLDTRKQFSAAQYLYRSSGFQETEKYNDNEHAELYFELIL